MLVSVGDFVSRNVTGLPELGQMLATGRDSFTLPVSTLVVGGAIFVIIMGFNLVGEGLRRQVSMARPSRRTAISSVVRWIGSHIGAVGQKPTVRRGRGHMARLAGVALLGIAVGGFAWWWAQSDGSRMGLEPRASSAVIALHRSQPWGTERGDPFGTLESQATRAITPTVQWVFEDETGFTGGPVVAANGTIYLVSKAGTLYALDPRGTIQWSITLPAPPAGSPALSDEGTIYVAGKTGTLFAVSSAGRLQWQVQSRAGREATAGPIVGQDGTVYYTLVDRIQAVSPAGQLVWLSSATDAYIEVPPRVSPANDLVFLKDGAFDRRDGSPQDLRIIEGAQQSFGDPTYLIGADGQTYFRSGHTVIQWRQTAAGIERVRTIVWDLKGFELFLPSDAGVTREKLVWFFYAGEFGDARVVWLDPNSGVSSNRTVPLRQSRVIAVDYDATISLCGRRASRLECHAVRPNVEQAIWQVPLARGGEIRGGARVQGRLYVTTDDGLLYAIGDEQS